MIRNSLSPYSLIYYTENFFKNFRLNRIVFMQTIIDHLSSLFLSAIQSAFPELQPSFDPSLVEVTQSTNAKFGDYQFNSAMKLTKTLKLPPREIAEKIVAKLSAPELIASLEIAGPGFVNIRINPAHLSKAVQNMLRDPLLGVPEPKNKKRVIIDFSSPNTAKEMHVGHLRSTIIGDCLARTFEFLHYDVLRLNHIGDWGTAFGMLITHMKEKAPKVLSGEEDTNLTHLVQWYKESKKQFDEDLAFKKASQLEVVALQSGDKDTLKAWEIICDISRKAYQEIYDLLGVTLIERGESFYNPMLPETVKNLESKGLVTLSGGAKCLFMEGFTNREGEPLPLMIQKSDGGYNYDTTDMAAIIHRIKEEKGERLIYVTDAGQATHFEMIFKAAEMAGYLDREKVQVDHVPFGLVLGADGKKFKTRSGDTERLIDLLTKAIDHAENILKERSPTMEENERKTLAKALGIGAIKYADLSCHRTGDYVFSYDRMLKFEGNTAAFLMYCYVRVEGIKRKIKTDLSTIEKSTEISLSHPSEIALGMHLCQFGETINLVIRDLLPNRLTDYLYGLAEKFNAFYRDCSVEGSPEQNSRLLLCEACARTMHTGLHLLGVETVEKM